MSPPRRRSARLAATSPIKPKATPELSSLTETDEGAHTPARDYNHKRNTKCSDDGTTLEKPTTPHSAGLRPSHEEMHPSKARTSIAAPSSSYRLGFTDIKPKDANQGVEVTPTKATVPSTDFTFSLAKSAANVELSDETKRMMEELRDRAAEIKADLVAKREAGYDVFGQRKIAQPTAKTGRYSDAHMAEFKKMDSIENHASLWRARHWTPVVKGNLKRSPSKANLDGTPQSAKSTLKGSPSKVSLHDTAMMKPGVKRSSKAADLDEKPGTPCKATPQTMLARARTVVGKEKNSFAKRLKKSRDDDTSTAKREPLDTVAGAESTPSSVNRAIKPSSSLSRLMSPTKSSLGHFAQAGKSTISLVSNNESSKTGPAKHASGQSVAKAAAPVDLKRRLISPRSVSRVKSILRGQRSDNNGKSAIPAPQTSQTPVAQRTVDKELPPQPLTTPRRKLTKRVAFTPDTKNVASLQDSPSPIKLRTPDVSLIAGRSEPSYPNLDGVLACAQNDVVYPDLKAFGQKMQCDIAEDVSSQSPSVPSSFTFRSDHTIQFGSASPTGFGAQLGQASVRQVRDSIAPGQSSMPGGFPAPASPSSHPDKENKVPITGPKSFFAHGLPNKKRHRASADEEDAQKESEQRAAKKRKRQDASDDHAPLAPGVSGTPSSAAKRACIGGISSTPSKTPSKTPRRTPLRAPATSTPNKKRPILSMSRLNALATPKQRT